jgi:hypothetical protein
MRGAMRLLPLIAVLLSGCSSMKSALLPGNSRAKEQTRLNAATEPEPRNRQEEIMRPDEGKEFNLQSANFGSGRKISTGAARTNEFYFVDKTRTKSFATRDFTTKDASNIEKGFTTKEMPVKESWFSRLASGTKSYSTKEHPETDKVSETRALPGGDRAFLAKGRRQAALDSSGAKGMPQGGDRLGGESWSGDLKPLTIQDVKKLLNRN